ncbi:hypothetical protein GXB85_05905 [Cellulomonas sp. APG4]|uniref:hypothetical protein n=1 Tax=Cellulomonas sp. APG4 TaxID=1538656 RepID=UPI00137ACFC3|nr:hypothetical protein [Cellulomonas sp. APG4]NCT90482.1 hypothetical protein [Cellulomonas sp. APG4]
MTHERTVHGGCTFNRWRYATWPLVWARVEEHGFRFGARIWPVLWFGLLDIDRSLVDLSRKDRSALIPWTGVRRVELRRPNELELVMVDGWKLRFATVAVPLHPLVAEAHSRLVGSS